MPLDILCTSSEYLQKRAAKCTHGILNVKACRRRYSYAYLSLSGMSCAQICACVLCIRAEDCAVGVEIGARQRCRYDACDHSVHEFPNGIHSATFATVGCRPPGRFQCSARRAGKPASPRRIDSLRRRRQRGVGPASKSKKNWDARDEDDAVVVKLGVWQARGALGVNRDLGITRHIRKVALCSVNSAP
jgi:hypothetical protein